MGDVRMTPGLGRTWIRLFFYQASWTFERLQGIGMAFCIEPLLKTLPGGPGGEAHRAAMARAVAYFNTHPFFAGLVAGAVARAEHEGLPSKRIVRLRSALKGPVGSIGDRVIWSGVLPAAVGLGLLAAMWWNPLIGVAIFLIAFNTVHLGIRTWALRQGWRCGLGVGQALHRPWLQWSADKLRALALLVLGFAIPVLAQGVLTGADTRGRMVTVAVAAVTYVVSAWIAPTLGAARVGALAVGVGIVVGIL